MDQRSLESQHSAAHCILPSTLSANNTSLTLAPALQQNARTLYFDLKIDTRLTPTMTSLEVMMGKCRSEEKGAMDEFGHIAFVPTMLTYGWLGPREVPEHNTAAAPDSLLGIQWALRGFSGVKRITIFKPKDGALTNFLIPYDTELKTLLENFLVDYRAPGLERSQQDEEADNRGILFRNRSVVPDNLLVRSLMYDATLESTSTVENELLS